MIRQLIQNLPKGRFSNEILCIDGEVGELGRRLNSEHGIKIHTRQRQSGLDWRLAYNIRRLIRRGAFDIIHCHQYTPWFYGWMASLGTGAKLVFTEHGRFHPDKYRRKARLVNKLMAKTTDSVIAISESTRDALAEYEYLPRGCIGVIYNGIEPLSRGAAAGEFQRKQLRIPDDSFVVGTVARLDPVKNQRMMIKAFCALQAENASIYLVLVGDGPSRGELEALSEQLGVDDRVIFTGFQSQPADYLRIMDVFLLTSDTEGTSMTLLESMSLAKPAVATAVGGNTEIIADGETGMLIKAGDTEALAETIQMLKNDPSKRDSLGEKAHQRFVSLFSATTMAEKYQTLYELNTGIAS
ncbi:glycosyltransferase [Tamilnaduibacter salinus]|uniref:Glycosyltransferase n=1 Tax=Tamilnaduibacter salinus TaxID=1484056 RepID=A0A2A2I005_9GAMM|nr:glycosyltransferase [Tamilnaduibacter salinus]